jgi:hypothetical protein
VLRRDLRQHGVLLRYGGQGREPMIGEGERGRAGHGAVQELPTVEVRHQW